MLHRRTRLQPEHFGWIAGPPPLLAPRYVALQGIHPDFHFFACRTPTRLQGPPKTRTRAGAAPGIIATMCRPVWRWTATIAAVRLSAFLIGWWWMTRYSDWRQWLGYPVILVGSLPDAVFMRYVVDPKSPNWPIAIVLSLLMSSAIIVALFTKGSR